MIDRYSRPEMAQVWSDQNRFLQWLKVEAAVCQELVSSQILGQKEGELLQKKLQRLIQKGGIDFKKIAQVEAVTHHDLIAFTTVLAESIGPLSRYIHFGLTSSDVIDTALALVIQEAGAILLTDIQKLLKTLKRLAQKWKALPTIGRSHGIFAEPTSFGLKFLSWYCEWKRNETRLKRVLKTLQMGKLSGAVGANAHWAPAIEAKILKTLGLSREWVSTQVLPRDRHAELLSLFALLGASLERIAIELRHLQRSEVREVMEGFHKGQKGSSAMPHKRNPIASENITGCARLLRSYAQAAFENIALWHERDISHSSVERVIFPDAHLILDYALNRMNTVLEQLVVYPKRVRENLQQAGTTIFSGHILLALIQAGTTREQAYEWVQTCALLAVERQENFLECITKHPEVHQKISDKQLREFSSLQYPLRNVSEIYDTVFEKKGTHPLYKKNKRSSNH